MNQRYLDADQINEIERALLDGGDLESIAGQVGFEPDELSRLLSRPQWRRIPSDEDSVELDLFDAEERLEGLL